MRKKYNKIFKTPYLHVPNLFFSLVLPEHTIFLRPNSSKLLYSIVVKEP